LSDEPQLRGYRVRLRIVEEHDVALLAESPDDANARAEADVRRGDGFEDIQDSWPEERILSKRWLSSRTQNSSSRPLRPSRNSALVRGIVSACRFLQRVKAAVATLG
jgi:hypothetical protein